MKHPPEHPVVRVLGWLRRLLVLRHTLNRRRLRTAVNLLREKGIRVLLVQVRMHISFQSRMQQTVQSLDELPPPKPYTEPSWPADQPLVSVIIPCFNYGAFVAEAVDSVLSQTLRDIEIIVVEGGSTDSHTVDTLREFDRPLTTILFRDRPHRVGSNRNFGISHARGRYICCLDADDLLHPTYLEKSVFLIEQCGYDVVSTAVRRFGAVNETYGVLPTPDLTDLVAGNHVTTCAVFRRELWESAGGYEDVAEGTTFLHEDWRFWIRVAALGARFANIVGEQLFLYRAHHGASLSTGADVLPNEEQGVLIRKAEQALITPEKLELSRTRAAQRLRATDGPTNLLARDSDLRSTGPTLLLAMPFLVLGGAERLLSEVLPQLRATGYRLIIVTTVQSVPEHGDTTEWFKPATDEIYHLPRFLSPDRWQDFVDYAIEAKHVDILWIVGSIWFYEALPRLRIQFPALHIVDLLFNTIGHADNNRRQSANIDMILAENTEVYNWLLAHGEPLERVRLIPSGVDITHYTPSGRAGASDCFVAGFSGRLSDEKAPLAFLKIADVMNQQSKISFLMSGAGPLEERVCATIARHKYKDRVRFLGMVKDVRTALALYDVLVLPSEIDGRPTVVLEALAMGIPVIASAVGGLPDLVREGQTGFLCRPGDTAAFARAITTLQEDRTLHARMRAAAREFAERELGVDRMLEGYAAAFETLLRRSDRVPDQLATPLKKDLPRSKLSSH